MKKVAILSNYINSFDLPSGRLFSYIELTHIFKEHGIELVRVSIYSFDAIKGEFRDYADFNKDGQFEIFQESYKPDIIWNRSEDGLFYAYDIFEKFHIPVFPSRKLITIANDKYEMYLFLKDYQPESTLLKMFFSSEFLRKNFPERLTIKPIRSNSGKGIEFFTKDELIANKERFEGLGSLYIVQEFKDFSKGFPELVEGMHDVRLVYIGGKFSHATLRSPAVGSLKSNVGSGGSQVYLGKEQLPKELLELSIGVIKNLGIDNNNILSIDFGYVLDEKRWYVFEINDTPGVSVGNEANNKNGPLNTYFVNIAKYFLETI